MRNSRKQQTNTFRDSVKGLIKLSWDFGGRMIYIVCRRVGNPKFEYCVIVAVFSTRTLAEAYIKHYEVSVTTHYIEEHYVQQSI